MNSRPDFSSIEHAVRESAPLVLGLLVRRGIDFASAEDAVQEALVAALEAWRESGIPANPGGWLFQVARRKWSDAREADEARRRREESLFDGTSEIGASAVSREAPSIDSGFDVQASMGAREPLSMHRAHSAPDFTGDAEDDTLALLFLCCHRSLTPPSAIALTLRAIGGLTTAEIARAFMVPEATMAQRIARAKSTIEASGAAFGEITKTEREERLTEVMRVLYLIFNEGYAASGGEQLLRVELAVEAIRLARALHRVVPNDAETAGLLALMILTDARRRARTGALGEVIPLDEQDRSLWDRGAITEGRTLLERTLARGTVGEYQIQAAIAALHDEADGTQSTDWPQILTLYGLLERMNPSPMVALSRAIATAMVHGPEAGLRSLDELASDEHLRRNHRLTAARAHLLERAGDVVSAIEHYRAAADITTSTAERNYLLTKAARLAEK